MSKSKPLTSYLSTAGKFLLVILLLWWMISSKKIDMQKLRILIQDERVLLYNLLVWLGGCVILTSARWGILLRGLRCVVTFPRLIQLSLVGLFFTSVMPGAIGGDLIKAFYVYKDQSSNGKTPALLSIVLDRIIGLYSIFTLAVGVMCWHWNTIWQYTELHILLGLLIATFLGITAFFAIVLSPSHRLHKLLSQLLARIGIDLFIKVYDALRLFRDKPLYLVYAWAVSCVFQSALLWYYSFVSSLVCGPNVNFSTMATILPFAMIAVALPIAPGGVGVGHVAFEKLYSLIGLENGANVFNIVFFGQLIFNLLCFIPFLWIKTNVPSPNGEGDTVMPRE